MRSEGTVFEGKTLDDAVKKGLETLGLSRAEVMITVEEEGSGGFLGIGSRPYRVRIMPRPGGPPSEPDDRSGRRHGHTRGERDRSGRGGERRPRADRGGRTDRPARTDRPRTGDAGAQRSPARAERGDRPARPDRPERNDRPERGNRVEAGSRPERGPRAERSDRPDRAARPERSDRPERSERPERVDRPERGDRPDRGGRVDAGNRSERGDRPARGERPEGDDRFDRGPARGDRPEDGDRFDRVERDERPEAARPGIGPAASEGRSSEPRTDEDRGRRSRGRRGRGGFDRDREAPVEDRGARSTQAEVVSESEPSEYQESSRPRRGLDRERTAGGSSLTDRPALAPEELAVEAKRVTDELLEHMGFDGTTQAKAEEDRVEVTVNLQSGEDLLTGRKGEVRQALQHLLNLMINRGRPDRYHLQLEVNDFWQRREDELREIAKRLAEEALAGGTEAVTEYLNAQERRIIHVTLREDTRVKTYALGTGLIKRVAVAPADFAEGNPEEE